jgi:hypothetical protein
VAQLWLYDPIEQEENFFEIEGNDRKTMEFNACSDPYHEQQKFVDHVVLPLKH